MDAVCPICQVVRNAKAFAAKHCPTLYDKQREWISKMRELHKGQGPLRFPMDCEGTIFCVVNGEVTYKFEIAF